MHLLSVHEGRLSCWTTTFSNTYEKNVQPKCKAPFKWANVTTWLGRHFLRFPTAPDFLDSTVKRFAVFSSWLGGGGCLALWQNYLPILSDVSEVTKSNLSSIHFGTHSVVGVGSVVGEVTHGCVFSVAWGVQAFRGSSGHMVENEPEACFLAEDNSERRRQTRRKETHFIFTVAESCPTCSELINNNHNQWWFHCRVNATSCWGGSCRPQGQFPRETIMRLLLFINDYFI